MTTEASKAEPVASETDGTTESKATSVVPRKYRDRYRNEGHAGTCNDDIATTFKHCLEAGFSLDEIGELNGIDVQGRWGERNIGMQRMNLGNVLRGMARRHEPVQFPC